MSKPKKRHVPHYRTHDMTRGMDYQPVTPLGSTRLEKENRGPFRPGKTQQDYMPVAARPRVVAWRARLSRAQQTAEDRLLAGKSLVA